MRCIWTNSALACHKKSSRLWKATRIAGREGREDFVVWEGEKKAICNSIDFFSCKYLFWIFGSKENDKKNLENFQNSRSTTLHDGQKIATRGRRGESIHTHMMSFVPKMSQVSLAGFYFSSVLLWVEMVILRFDPRTTKTTVKK